jgi:hypothetical protein
MTSETRYCPTCKSTVLTFDPPIEIEPYEPCGELKPGTYATGRVPLPTCFEPKGHDGDHVAEIEYTETWPP